MRSETIGSATLYLGDCREILPSLPMANAVITDPPYGVNIAGWDNRVPYEFLNDLWDKCDGPIVWFGASTKWTEAAKQFRPEPERLAIWAPRFTLSKAMKNGLAYRWHPVFLWRLPKKHDGPTKDIWDQPTEHGNNKWNFPCTKPLWLMEDIVGFAQQGAIILDPFMGSGTTGVAALKRGRKFVGIDIDQRCFDVSCQRIEEISRQPDMFINETEQSEMILDS